MQLRPVVPELVPYLYNMLVGQHDTALRWIYRGATPTVEDFGRNLFSGTYSQYVGIRGSEENIVSYVAAHSASARDGHCHVLAAIEPSIRGRSAAGLISLGLLIDSLFEDGNFRKIYAQASEFNIPQYQRAVGDLFTVEGQLVAHEYYKGEYRDVFILALTRERWREYLQRKSIRLE